MGDKKGCEETKRREGEDKGGRQGGMKDGGKGKNAERNGRMRG